VANVTMCVCSRGGGWSSLAAATIMVGEFRIRIPTAAQVDSCTAEGVWLENIYFPNYMQDDHPLQNISSEWYNKHICNAK